jgi:hypothetical protein
VALALALAAASAWSLLTLPFTLETGETANRKPLPATMPGGIAVFDFDSDGVKLLSPGAAIHALAGGFGFFVLFALGEPVARRAELLRLWFAAKPGGVGGGSEEEAEHDHGKYARHGCTIGRRRGFL